MNNDFRERLLQKAQEIKAQRDEEESSIATLQEQKDAAEANAEKWFGIFQQIKESVDALGSGVPTLSKFKAFYAALKSVIEEALA